MGFYTTPTEIFFKFGFALFKTNALTKMYYPFLQGGLGKENITTFPES